MATRSVSSPGSPSSPNQSRYGVPERSVEVDPGVAPRPLRWSASSVSTFEQCPLKLWWGKVAGWQEGPSIATAAGSAVHGALEDLFRLEPAERTEQFAGAALARALEGARDELAAAEVPFEQVRSKAESALEVYWQVEDPTAIDVVADGVEREVGPQLGDVPFVGFVDRIAHSATGVRVTDYKTGAAKPRYFGPYFRQQYLYAAALIDSGVDVTEIELLFLADGRRVTRPVYDAALDRAVGTLQSVAEAGAAMAQQGVWTARQSPLCGWCSFESVCPLRKSRVPTPGSAESDQRLSALPGMSQRPPVPPVPLVPLELPDVPGSVAPSAAGAPA